MTFKSGVTEEEVSKYAQKITGAGGEITKEYNAFINGFIAVIPDDFLVSLQSDVGGDIETLEPDGVSNVQ
ncbi:hypothetical protein [Streptomyces sp. NPDC057682]|uniref:hypothetical protein n=1 Tax=Streptomyces sp. NPDC057682 TaxID=3346210 RepID=UPI0036CA39AB